MKQTFFLITILALVLTACEDSKLHTYSANVPIYLSYDELRTSFQITADEPLVQPGKIYFKDQYMYINEYQKGIHVVDLSIPANPVKKAFINIPGNVDMAIKDDMLYADSYVDLVLIDISNPVLPNEVKRMEDLFEYVIPTYDWDYPLDEIDEEKGVITSFEIKKVTKEIYDNPYPWPVFYDYMALESSSVRYNAKVGGGGSAYGVGGSMARFITYDDYLYTLESTYNLKTIDISNLDQPVVKNEQYLWGNVETIFISDEYMYVGTSNGMHIMSLQEPSVPNQVSTYQHVTACDPVVVDGNRAYVTLRAGNMCGGTQDLLEVIDIANKYEPKRMVSYAMSDPYGLGIDGSTLFVCEGDYGLKVYDASDPYAITSNKIADFPAIHAHDVIPLSSFLFMIGDDGFYIYDYSNLTDISLLGTLPVVPSEE
jgi:hypothetical protein